jgi:hypothetical protein
MDGVYEFSVLPLQRFATGVASIKRPRVRTFYLNSSPQTNCRTYLDSYECPFSFLCGLMLSIESDLEVLPRSSKRPTSYYLFEHFYVAFQPFLTPPRKSPTSHMMRTMNSILMTHLFATTILHQLALTCPKGSIPSGSGMTPKMSTSTVY